MAKVLKHAAWILTIICGLFIGAYAEGIEIHVSSDGTDFNNNSASRENPLATLKGARDFLRAMGDFEGPAEVIFHGGVYVFDSTVSFAAEDSGTWQYPVTYKAAPGERVVFSGAKRLESFAPVTDEAILDRLYPEVRGKVIEVNLSKEGISAELINFTRLHDTQSGTGENVRTIQFYLNDKAQRIARWPNSGYRIMTSAAASGGQTTIYYNQADSEPTRWTNAENMFLEGNFDNDYQGEWARVDEVMPESGAIKLKYSVSAASKSSPNGRKWAAVNLLEEIDVPGEWYVDKDTMMLYYYPPYELSGEDVLEISVLDANFISMSSARYIRFEGIEFAKNAPLATVTSRYVTGGGNAISLSGTYGIEIVDCIIRDIGAHGIIARPSTNTTIDGCMFYNIGLSAVLLYEGGSRSDLTPSENVIKNCFISNVSRAANNNIISAILLYSGDTPDNVGVLIENNVISNISNSAIRYKGLEHYIRYNEIYNAVNSAGDGGAIYCGRSWAEYGGVIEYNYIHDIGAGSDWYWAAAVYFDDGHSGNTLRKNIIRLNNKLNDARGVMINSGRDNTVGDNIFISGVTGVHGGYIDPADNRIVTARNALLAAPFQSDMYKSQYPGMLENYNDYINGQYNPKNTVTGNLHYDMSAMHSLNSKITNASTISGNMTASGDIFVNPQEQDYRIKNEAKQQLGLPQGVVDESFNISLIGPQKNKGRYEAEGAFKLLYPQRGQYVSGGSVTLCWEATPLADAYKYTVSTSADFTEIVFSGIVKDTFVRLEALDEFTPYYWKVSAVNNSRFFEDEYECGEVFYFNAFSAWGLNYDDGRLTWNVYNSTDELQYTIAFAVKNEEGEISELIYRNMTAPARAQGAEEIEFEQATDWDSIHAYIWEKGTMNPLSKKVILKKGVY